MSEVVLRPARSDEHAALQSLVRAAFADYVPLMGRRPSPMDASFSDDVAAGRALVLTDDTGGLLGCAICRPKRQEDGEDVWYLDVLAVAPDAQGRGYGDRLLAAAEQQGRAAGFSKITLITNVVMTDSIAFYRRRGFVQTWAGVDDGYNRLYFAKDL